MLLKKSYFWPLCSAEPNDLGNFGRWHYEKHLSEIYWSFCLVGQNSLGNFGRRPYEEHLCEAI